MSKIKLPFIGIGTWGLRGEVCKNTILAALRNGYRVIDTASVYQNEKVIGNIIHQFNRNDIEIISKINTFKYEVGESINQSLKDLKSDYINVMLIHWPIFKTSLYDYLDKLQRLKNNGKILEIGVSNFNSSLLLQANKQFPNLIKYNQIEYHPFLDQSKLFSIMKKLKIHPIAYCPLSRGKIYKNKMITKIANNYKKTSAQIILKWILKQNISAVPGSSNKKNIIQNISINDFDISDTDMSAIFKLNKKNFRNIDNISKYKWD